MDKKIIIAGGVGVVVIGGFIFMRAKNKAAVERANSDGQASAIQSTGSIPSYESSVYSSMLPISGGMTSQSYTSAPSDPANSGSTNSGGGFDFGAVLSSIMGNQAANQSAQVKANATTSDSAILSGIIGNNSGGTISHTGDGTVININKPSRTVQEQILDQTYMELLGRKPDVSGEAFWENKLINESGFGIANLAQALKDSPEYKAKHPNG